MKRSRFTETQIVAVLKEANSGGRVKDLCRKHGISQLTYFAWRSKNAMCVVFTPRIIHGVP